MLGGLLLALMLAEIGLRVVGLFAPAVRLPFSYQYDALDRLAAAETYVIFDQELGWIATPGVSWERDEIIFQHNSAGMRADHEYNRLPSPEIRRIAAYGDSFTYCDDVNAKDCWTAWVEERLPSAEVLNFGVPGYEPGQAWLRYGRDGASWSPCAVIIGLSSENINRIVNRFRPFYTPATGIVLGKPRFLLRGDQLELLPNPATSLDDLRDPRWVETAFREYDSWYFPGTFVANPLDVFETVRLIRTAAYNRPKALWDTDQARRMYVPGNEAFDLLAEILTSFSEVVRANGATPVVVVFPRKDEIPVSQREPVYAPLTLRLRQRGLAVIDLGPRLGGAARRLSLGELVERHYRPAGNAVVGRVLVEQLPDLTAATCH